MNAIENPWRDLGQADGEWVLADDRQCLRQCNALCRKKDKRFWLNAIPEPFIGNPDQARVVLLGKNPGYSPADESDHCHPQFRAAILGNLRHDLPEYPFYPLNPAFRDTGAGKWWLERTRELREVCQLRQLASRLMVIEWFPYHSKTFTEPKGKCGSQEYSFHLARKMFEKSLRGEVIVIGMRAEKLWAKIEPRFAEIPYLRSAQSVHISRRNAGPWFDRIVEAISRDT